MQPDCLPCLDPCVPLLNRDQYLATMGDHPRRVEDGAAPPVDFWDYVDQIPTADLGGRDFSQGDVSLSHMPGTRLKASGSTCSLGAPSRTCSS